MKRIANCVIFLDDTYSKEISKGDVMEVDYIHPDGRAQLIVENKPGEYSLPIEILNFATSPVIEFEPTQLDERKDVLEEKVSAG